MKFKTGIITLMMTLLFASSAFASSLVIHTGFEEPEWDTNLYGEGWQRGMDFIGNWRPGDGGAGINNDGSVIGSSYTPGYETGAGGDLGIRFVGPNEQSRSAQNFFFTYQEQANPIYLSIDMNNDLNSVGFDPNNPAQYYQATGLSGDGTDGFQFMGYSGDVLLFELTGTTTTYPPILNEPDADPSFFFYMNNGFETLLTIEALFFTSYNPFGPPTGLEGDLPGMDVVELTAFDYTPTPIPGAAWLLGSGLIGLVGLRRRFKG